MKIPSSRRRAFLATGAVSLFLIASVWFATRGSEPERVSMEAASRLELPHVRSSFSPKNQRDDAQARYQYELMRLRDPETGRIPEGIRTRELAFASTLPRADQLAAKSGGLMAQEWTFRGPNNVGGRTRALGVDLRFDGASNRRILAGGISGGIYLSEDEGTSWTLTTGLGDLASVTSLSQDPSNPDVWYFGTGEFLGNSAGGGLQQYYGQGLFKSVDGGFTWAQLQSTVEGELHVFDSLWDYVWNVKVDANGVVFAATFGGVLRSTDGGASWEYVLGRQSTNDPFNSTTDVAIGADGAIYASMSRNGSGSPTYGIFKSTNGGDQWSDITPPDFGTDPYRIVLGPAPSNAGVLYVLAQTDQQGANASHHQLFRTNDGGTSWTDLSGSVPDEAGVDGNASFSTQGGYDQIVVVKPDDPNTVFVGGTNLYRSTDGGSTFARIGGYASPANYAQVVNHHSDQHSLAFLPTNPSVAISGHDGGLSKSTNILAEPHSWTSLNNGYVTTQFYTVAIDPQAGGNALIGGMQDNGTWGTESLDGTVEWSELFGGDGAYAAIAPGVTAFYVSAQNGLVFRLRGNDFASVTPAGAQQFMFINPFVLDPNDPRIMYMGEAGGVWRNSNLDDIPDGGQDPTSINWAFLDASARANTSTTTIGVSKTPANRIYFGVTDYQSQTALIRLDDAGANAAGVDITPPVTSDGFPPFPSSIAVNPNDGDEIVAVFSNYNIQSIWHSTDAGASWTNVDGNLSGIDGPSVRTAAIVPTSSGKLYVVGTSTGVYSASSIGAGTTWALEGAEVLGNIVVDMLAARPEDGTIVAATHGRGVYQAAIGGGGAGAVAAIDQNQLDIEVAPGNMASTTFILTNTGAADLTFTVGGLGKTGTTATRIRLTPDPGVRSPSAGASKFGSTAAGPNPESANVSIPPSSASIPAGEDLLVLDDGSDSPDDFLGWGDGTTPFQWGSRFYAPVGGFALDAFYVYMRSEEETSFPVSVFITDPEGNVYISGDVELPPSDDGSAGDWYYIFFDPIDLPEGQAFDIELVAPAAVFYPAGVDLNGAVPGSGFYWVNSGLDGWYAELAATEGYENAAWLIRAEGTAGGGSLNQPPTASFTASASQAAVGETIDFDGSGSHDPDGTIAQFAWTFGDGGTSDQTAPSHSYSQPGTYTVTLTVTDDEGATGQTSKQLTIVSDNEPPIAQIQASQVQAVVNESITFDGSGSTDPDGSIATYAWTFGDGNSSSQVTAEHAYTQAGAYTVNLTVTDNEGATDKASLRIDVLSEPSRLSVTPVSGTIAPGASQVITVTYDASTQVAGEYAGEVNLTTNGGNFKIPVSVRVDETVDVDRPEEVPQSISLAQNYPNPFNPQTTLRFTLDQPASVHLTVFDLHGRVVRVLVDGEMASGIHQVSWDGADASGRAVASGTYLYRLEAQSGNVRSHFTRKMILLR